MLRKQSEMNTSVYANCHDGIGNLLCYSVLTKEDSGAGIQFMHYDEIEPGASIGEHLHQGTEEIYFIIRGEGEMLMDGAATHVRAGDVSLVRSGHTHGLINSSAESLNIIVLCAETKG